MTTPNHDNLLRYFWTAFVTSLSIFPFFWFTTMGQQLEVIFKYITPENNKPHMDLVVTYQLPLHFLPLAILPKPQGQVFPKVWKRGYSNCITCWHKTRNRNCSGCGSGSWCGGNWWEFQHIQSGMWRISSQSYSGRQFKLLFIKTSALCY